MKPIIGEISYPDLSPEEINRYRREAEKLGALAFRETLISFAHAVSGGVKGVLRSINQLGSTHKAAGAR